MKRIIGLILMILIFYPIVVKANIVCNDGTTSPSCTTCHRGCCSKHGGCSSSSSGSSSSSSGSTSSSSQRPVVPEKVKSGDTSLKKVVIDEEEILINDSMLYSTTKENVKLLVVVNDSKATVDYKKDHDLVIGENIIDIKVTAENGNVKNYKLSITREKVLSDNKNINIFVDGKKVVFNLFKSNEINIANDKDKIDITYELEDANAKVEIIGNEDLQVGYNEVIVKAIAENGDEQSYTLVIQKENKKEEEKVDIQEEIIDNQSADENETNIFTSLGSLVLLGGTGCLVYKGMKRK